MKLQLICAIVVLKLILRANNTRPKRAQGEKFNVLLNLYKMNPLKQSTIFYNYSNIILDPSKDEYLSRRFSSYESITNSSENVIPFNQFKLIEDAIHTKHAHHKKVIDPPNYKVSYKSENFNNDKKKCKTKLIHDYPVKDKSPIDDIDNILGFNNLTTGVQDVMPHFKKMRQIPDMVQNPFGLLDESLPVVDEPPDTKIEKINYDFGRGENVQRPPVAQKRFLVVKKTPNRQNLIAKAWTDIDKYDYEKASFITRETQKREPYEMPQADKIPVPFERFSGMNDDRLSEDNTETSTDYEMPYENQVANTPAMLIYTAQERMQNTEKSFKQYENNLDDSREKESTPKTQETLGVHSSESDFLKLLESQEAKRGSKNSYTTTSNRINTVTVSHDQLKLTTGNNLIWYKNKNNQIDEFDEDEIVLH